MVTLDDIKILHEFLSKKNIDFVLTGTTGLYIHGLLPDGYKPEDVDIIVVASKATHGKYLFDEFMTIQKLAGGPAASENYKNECFTFKIGPNNTKVNAIMCFIETDPTPTYIELTFGGNLKKTLKLHAVNEILNTKFSLHRTKDYKFFKDLIATISSMC